MTDVNKKELLELRIMGTPTTPKTVRVCSMINNENSNSNNPIHFDSQIINDESQKSLADSQGSNSQNRTPRGRKRKSVFNDNDKTQQNNIQLDAKFESMQPALLSSFVAKNQSNLNSNSPIGAVNRILENDHELLELRKRNSDLEVSLKEYHEIEKRLMGALEISRDWLKTFLIQDYKTRKQQVLDTCTDNCKRIGQFAMVRQGPIFVEDWQDGSDFKKIANQIIENNRMKDELEKFKKLINKLKPTDKPAVNIKSPTEKVRRSNRIGDELSSTNISLITNNQSLSPEEYYKLDELYKTRQSLLRKEEMEIAIENKKLQQQRNLHCKEMKRIASEENSRFNNNPTMNNRYLLLDLVGKGGFSEVYKAFDMIDFKYVACKIHQLLSEWKEDKKANYFKHATREYEIHKTLDHPNIVKMFDVFEIDNHTFVTIMEFCDGNDLDFLLRQFHYLPERETRSLILQIVSALKYLNDRRPPIIHYDLKPGNILLLSGANAWHVKLADFGLSKILPHDVGDCSMDLTSPGAGTYWYLPPECFSNGIQPTKISSKVDVWSVGIIFYQCLYGKRPFGDDLTQASILEKNTILCAKNVEFPAKPPVSNDAKNFIRSCLVYMKDMRMDVLQMSESTYLKHKKPERLLSITNSDRVINVINNQNNITDNEHMHITIGPTNNFQS